MFYKSTWVICKLICHFYKPNIIPVSSKVKFNFISKWFVQFFICRIFKLFIFRTLVVFFPRQLITYSTWNNGIAKYIKQLPNRTLFCYKDTLALADRGVFFATTQKENFHIGTRVKALIFKDGEKSEAVRLFSLLQ